MPRSHDARERLSRAARKAFARKGYANTSVREIAVAAGLTTGAVYSQFGSKLELLAQSLRGVDQPHAWFVGSSRNARATGDLLLAVAAEASRAPQLRRALAQELGATESNLLRSERDVDMARIVLAVRAGELLLTAAGLTLPKRWEDRLR